MNLTKIISAAGIVLITITSAFAQQSFEGEAEFSLTITGLPREVPAAGLLPKKLTIHVKNETNRMKMDGGLFTDVLSKPNEPSYLLVHDDKIAYSLPEVKEENNSKDKVKVTPTGEYATIVGYKARKYLIETNEGGKIAKSTVWATNEFKTPIKFGDTQGFFPKGFEGFPLKIEGTYDEMTIIIEAIKVKPKKLNDSLFEVPESYKVEEFDVAAMQMKMMQKMMNQMK